MRALLTMQLQVPKLHTNEFHPCFSETCAFPLQQKFIRGSTKRSANQEYQSFGTILMELKISILNVLFKSHIATEPKIHTKTWIVRVWFYKQLPSWDRYVLMNIAIFREHILIVHAYIMPEQLFAFEIKSFCKIDDRFTHLFVLSVYRTTCT